jgi:hypothetical protein
MSTGQIIKRTISNNNKIQRENRLFNKACRFSINSESFVKKIRPRLLYQHLQRHYCSLKTYCSMCISLYLTWIAAGRSLEGEGYD